MVSGATQNKAKHAVATRVENQRKVADLLEQAPPMKNPKEYNGGLGKAALGAEDWLNGLKPVNPTAIQAGQRAADSARTEADRGRATPEKAASTLNSAIHTFEAIIKDAVDGKSIGARRLSAVGYLGSAYLHEAGLSVDEEKEISFADDCAVPAKSTWLPAAFDMIADDYFALERVHFPDGYFVWHPPHLWQARTAGYRCALQQVIELSKKPEPASPAVVAALQSGDEVISKEEVALTQSDAFKVFEQTEPASEKAAINWLVKDGFDEVDAKKHWAAWCKAKKSRSNEDLMAEALEAKYPIKPETIDGLVEAIEYAVKHSNKPESLTLTDGFYAVEVDDMLRIKHPALPDINRTIGVKLVSGIYGRAIQRGEVRSLLLRLKEVNSKKAEARQDAARSVTAPVTQTVTDASRVTPAKRDTQKNMVKVGNELVAGL